MTRLLFVVPNYLNDEVGQYSRQMLIIPYGVLSLTSYIEHYCPDVQCEIIDLTTFDNKAEQEYALDEKIKNFSPDIVGISVMFNFCFREIAPLCEKIKDASSDITIFAGGVVATNMARELLDSTDLIDAICMGEGEIPLKDLLANNNFKEAFTSHPSWITKSDLKNGKQPEFQFVDNLDDIPIINYSKIDTTKYSARTASSEGSAVSLPMHSSRGCPYSCIFCTIGTHHGKRVRVVSAKRFLSDVKTLIEKYNVHKISIDDDQFLFYKDRAIEILKGLAEFDIDIELATGITVKFIDEEVATLLKRAGLKSAFIAVESGSPRVLKDIMKKPLKLSQVKPAVDSLRKAGVIVTSPFVIGFPGETQEDRDLTREFILKTGFDWCYIFVATPFKGSRLYDICVENNYFNPSDFIDLNLNKCVINAPGIVPEEIDRKAYLLNLDVNFVNNYNFKQKNYELALNSFLKITVNFPDHAFSHYYASLCYKNLNDEKNEKYHMKQFEKIIDSDSKWKNFANELIF